MRQAVIGTAVSVGLLVGSVQSASALFGAYDIVFDPTSFAEQVRHGAEELKNQVQELFNWTQQLRWASDTFDEVSKVYDQGERIYYAANHLTSIGGIMSAMGILGIHNPLPFDPSAVIALTNGTGSISGMRYAIPGLFHSSYAGSYGYEVTGPQAQWMRERATSNAGTQALAGQLYEDMAQRQKGLEELQAKIDGADEKDLAALHARIAVEQSYIQAQAVQAQSLGMMQTAGWRSIDLRSEQTGQQNIDAVVARLTPQ